MKELKNVFIVGTGSFLPGEPVNNESIESHLGFILDKPSRSKRRILESNQIKTRHYAITPDHSVLYSNATMAKEALLKALEDSHLELQEIELLSAGTTVGDLLAPGHASMVHGELGGPVMEISTSHGICASSMMALKNAFLQVQSGEKRNALACGSEFVSRTFRASRYSAQGDVKKNGVSFDTDFLRWMLSDGAGACVLSHQPRPRGKSLKIEWIDLRSHANQFDVCMYLGGEKNKKNGQIESTWATEKDDLISIEKGHLNLKQDIKMLDDVVKVGIKHLVDLIESKRVSIDKIDWMLCHYSSHYFKSKIHDFLEKAGIYLPESKWYTNLYDRGNTGAASIYIMIDEFLKTKDCAVGDRILCMVPESGRFISSFMLCTVVDSENAEKIEAPADYRVSSLTFRHTNNPCLEGMIRKLGQIWIEFESQLNNVAFVKKLNRRQFDLETYKTLLLNLRPQVIEGNAWIAHMISSIDKEHFEFRSYAFEHAIYGYKDYQQLDQDYVSVGGKLEDIQKARRNIGSEALNAFMHHIASERNPFSLLGAMFIIEGLSSKLCRTWKEKIKDQLNLSDQQLTFLTHHSTHLDEYITSPILDILERLPVTQSLVDSIATVAKTTARLYLLQLEEIGNY